MERINIMGPERKRIRYVLGYLILNIILTSTLSYGQQLDPFCQNIGSGSNQSNALLLDWNMGESLSTLTYQSKSNLLFSSGFLQNKNDALATYKNLDSFKLNILIGPNPIQNNFTITCSQEGIEILHIKITDSFGNCLQEIKGPYSGLNFKKQLHLNAENRGIYYLIINYVIGGTVKNYKISKLLKI